MRHSQPKMMFVRPSGWGIARNFKPRTTRLLYVQNYTNDASAAPAVPVYKFRLPDLQLEQLAPGTVLTKWYKHESDCVKQGEVLCQIETPEMVLDLDSERSGYIAEILVPKGSKDIAVGKTLCILVDSKDEIVTYFSEKNNPSSRQEKDEIEAFQSLHDQAADASSDTAADILRVLKTLHKKSQLLTPDEYSTLKSMARNNDSRLITTYEGSFEGKESTFDAEFFIENVRDLVFEIRNTTSANEKQ